jgi:hypothetical protein
MANVYKSISKSAYNPQTTALTAEEKQKTTELVQKFVTLLKQKHS